MKLYTASRVLWLLVMLPPRAHAQTDASQASWEYQPVTDDFTGKSDKRLVLAARRESSDRLGDTVRARLIIACGKIFRGNGNKTMIFDAGIPMRWIDETMGMKYTDVDVRFDGDDKPKSRRGQLVDEAGSMLYLGDFGGFFFSKGMFKSMMASKEMRIRFSPLLGNTVETVAFDLRGLDQQIAKLGDCQWPK